MSLLCSWMPFLHYLSNKCSQISPSSIIFLKHDSYHLAVMFYVMSDTFCKGCWRVVLIDFMMGFEMRAGRRE